MRTTKDIFLEVITLLTEPQLIHKCIIITPAEGGTINHKESLYFAIFDNYHKRIAQVVFKGDHWAIGRCHNDFLRLRCNHIQLGEMEYFVNPLTKAQFEDQEKVSLIVEVPVL